MSSAEFAAGRRPLGRDQALDWVAERGVYVGLLLLVAFNLVFTPRFAEIDNIRLQFVQVVPVAIIALGMALVIGTRGIDLSVGSASACWRSTSAMAPPLRSSSRSLAGRPSAS